MTMKLADDFDAINARMREIAQERSPVVADEIYGRGPMMVLVDEPKATESGTYMGWDIYAPFSPVSCLAVLAAGFTPSVDDIDLGKVLDQFKATRSCRRQ